MNANTIDCDFADVQNWGLEMNERLGWLCENEPVYYSEKTDLWIISGYDACCEVSKTPSRKNRSHPSQSPSVRTDCSRA